MRTLFDYLKEHQAPLVKLVARRRRARGAPGAARSRSNGRSSSSSRWCGGSASTTKSWRLDPTVHPFASGTGQQDIRVTTRYFERLARRPLRDDARGRARPLRAPGRPALERTPLGSGTSLGMHESQSRMWENLVGRSLPMWRHFFPRLAESCSRTRSAATTSTAGTARSTPSEPSLIRVEADEATYNLHIILRFELEQELLDESFPLESLPEEWNRRMWELLGVEVPDDTRGVLQDTHWAIGAIGYFPTYALGNLISAQLWERILADIPGPRGELRARRVRRRCASGCASTSTATAASSRRRETLERAIGAKAIDPEPYVRYLQQARSARSTACPPLAT